MYLLIDKVFRIGKDMGALVGYVLTTLWVQKHGKIKSNKKTEHK